MATLEGMRIAVVDADGPLGAPTLAALAAAGAAVAPVTVAADGDATAGVERAIDVLGGLDVLANLSKPTDGRQAGARREPRRLRGLVQVVASNGTHCRTRRRSVTCRRRASGHVINHAEMAAPRTGRCPGVALPAHHRRRQSSRGHAPQAGAWFFQGILVECLPTGRRREPRTGT